MLKVLKKKKQIEDQNNKLKRTNYIFKL